MRNKTRLGGCLINFEKIIGLQVITSGAHILGEVKGAKINRINSPKKINAKSKFTTKFFLDFRISPSLLVGEVRFILLTQMAFHI